MYGFKAKNSFGNVILSSETVQFQFIGKATHIANSEVWLDDFDASYTIGGGVYTLNSTDEGVWYGMVIDSPTPPLCFVYQKNQGTDYAAAVLSVKYNGTNKYAITIIQRFPTGQRPALPSVEVYCFARSVTALPDFGMALYDKAGEVVFHSDMDLLNIEAMIRLPHWNDYSGLLFPHGLQVSKAAAPVFSNIGAASNSHSDNVINAFSNTERVCEWSGESFSCETTLHIGGSYSSLNYIQKFRHIPCVHNTGISHSFLGQPFEVVSSTLSNTGLVFPAYNEYYLPVIDGANYD
jgi:hypothetical protein